MHVCDWIRGKYQGDCIFPLGDGGLKQSVSLLTLQEVLMQLTNRLCSHLLPIPRCSFSLHSSTISHASAPRFGSMKDTESQTLTEHQLPSRSHPLRVCQPRLRPSWVGPLDFLLCETVLFSFFFLFLFCSLTHTRPVSVEILTVGWLRPCTGQGAVPNQDEL